MPGPYRVKKLWLAKYAYLKNLRYNTIVKTGTFGKPELFDPIWTRRFFTVRTPRARTHQQQQLACIHHVFMTMMRRLLECVLECTQL